MPDVPINLGVQSRNDRGDNTSRLMNCFAEAAGEGGRVQYPIYAEYGLKRDLALPYGQAIRGAITVRDDALGVEFAYVVSGNNLFKITTDGTHVLIPQSIADGRLTMARNGKLPFPQISICVDGFAYIVQTDLIDDNDTAALITDVDLPAPNSVEEIGQRFVYSTTSGQFYLSGVNDGGSIDPLDFDAADVKPDGILLTKRISEGRLLIFGNDGVEFWRHTGAADFPLERDIGSTLEIGTYSPQSIAVNAGYLGYVDSEGVVWLVTPAGVSKISTKTVQRDIAAADKTLIIGTFYSIEGAQFYCISTDDWTWKYNRSTGLWHECKSYGLNRWRGGVSFQFNNKTLICDYSGSRIYELRNDYFKEDDDPLIMELTTPDQQAFPNGFRVNTLFIDMLVGVGQQTAQSNNYEPRLMVQFSDDGGRTWSNERLINIGRIGQTEKRVKAYRFGACRTGHRAWRFKIAADVAKGLKQAKMSIDVLST